MSNDPALSSRIRQEFQSWGLCADEFEDTDNFPTQLYDVRTRSLAAARLQTDLLASLHAPTVCCLLSAACCHRSYRLLSATCCHHSLLPVATTATVCCLLPPQLPSAARRPQHVAHIPNPSLPPSPTLSPPSIPSISYLFATRISHRTWHLRTHPHPSNTQPTLTPPACLSIHAHTYTCMQTRTRHLTTCALPALTLSCLPLQLAAPPPTRKVCPSGKTPSR